TFEEELDRVVFAERLERELALAGHAKPHAARGEELQLRRTSKQRRELLGGGKQVLEVVEQDEGFRIVEIVERASTGVLGDRGADERRIPHRRQRDEERAVAEVVCELGGDLHRETRLAASARAGDRHEPRPVA